MKFVGFMGADGEMVAVAVDEVALVRERKGETFIVLKGAIDRFFKTDGTYCATIPDEAAAKVFDGMNDEPMTGTGAIFVTENFKDVVAQLNAAAKKGAAE